MDSPAVTRIFLNWNRPLLPQAAERLAAAYGDGRQTLDLRGVTVVLPGARAGRRLKELLLEAAEGRGRRLVPPSVVTVGVLPELLYRSSSPHASSQTRRLAWARALMDGNRGDLARVFSALPDAGQVLDWTSLGDVVGRLSREVAAGGDRFPAVAAACRGLGRPDEGARWTTLAGVQARYGEILRGLGRADPDLARLEALEEGGQGGGDAGPRLPGDVWLVGVAEMPRIHRALLERAGAGTGPEGGRIHALVHAPESESGAFDPWGCALPEAWEGRRAPLPDPALHVVDTPADQAARVVRILAGLNGQFSAQEIALGTPDGAVIPALSQALPRAGVPVRSATGTPLERTGPARLLEVAADWLATRSYESFAAFIRHPDLGTLFETRLDGDLVWTTLEAVDLWQQTHIPAHVPEDWEEGRRTLSTEESPVQLFAAELDRRLEAFREARPLGAWGPPILEFLAGTYAPLGLREERADDGVVLRALDRIRDACHGLAGIPAELDRPVPGEAALRFVLEGIRGEEVPAPPDDQAVEMLGWLELHLDDAPVAVLTGVNEGTLPESGRGDAFLPDALRRVLGLEDNRGRWARDLYRLTAMVHAREVLHLVSGLRTAEGDPLRPSRLLFAADPETVVRRVRRLYGAVPGGDEGGSGTGPWAGDPGEGSGPSTSGFRLPPEPKLPFPGLPSSISVTTFRKILEDPYTWALTDMWRTDAARDDALEMDGGAFGDLAHRVLEAWGREEVERQERGELLEEGEAVWRSLEPILDRQVAGRFGPRANRARVAVRLQVEQLRSRLRAFAHWQAGRTAAGWRILMVEAGGHTLAFPFDADPEGTIDLRARIDRIDVHPETGAVEVLDYKTSDAGDDPERTHRKGRTGSKVWKDLQLPLYHWVARQILEFGDPDVEPDIRVGYVLLPRDLGSVGASMAQWDGDLMEDGIQEARRVLRQLRDTPELHFDPERRPAHRDPELEALLGRSVLGSGAGEGEEGGEG